jgi:uncharacterized protein YgbK (DUF1537 family)
MTALLLGIVADDATGACDVADAVCSEGLSAAVVFGVPAGPVPETDCVVVALKSRTVPADEAVAASTSAAKALAHARLLYQKYCSTFDSTDAGNIGPVADALTDLRGARRSVGTPATPQLGRTAYLGHLFVGRQLLAESPLRDHPLTPMRDSDLVRLLARQTPHPVASIPHPVVACGPAAIARAIADTPARHLLLDAIDDADLDAAARALVASDEPVVVGGAAGLAAALARALATGASRQSAAVPAATPGSPRLIVSGSCSAATQEQVAAFAGRHIVLSPDALAADADGTVSDMLDRLGAAFAAGSSPVLVASTAEPADVLAAQRRYGAQRTADLLERAAGEIARRAVRELGVERLIVAGGETSGAVGRALGLDALHVGPRVEPGLAWMSPRGGQPLAVLLKSGNFGSTQLFTTAWEACP